MYAYELFQLLQRYPQQIIASSWWCSKHVINLKIFAQRLSEVCCFAVTQLLGLGKSVISNANKVQDQEIEEEMEMIDWPEDYVERAKIIRTKVQSMTGDVEAVFNSFVAGKLWFRFLYLAFSLLVGYVCCNSA